MIKFINKNMLIIFISLFMSNQIFCVAEQKPLYPEMYPPYSQSKLFDKALKVSPGEDIIFFSQVGEDAILASVFAKEVGEGKGFYIDVGAHEPKNINVSYYFYKKGWRGISIEPIKKYINELNSVRPNDINLNMLVGKEEGEGTLNEVQPRYNEKEDASISALSTTNSDQRTILEKQNYKMSSYQVPMTTMNQIFEKYVPKGQDVHFLKIDVEGGEKDVLLGMNFKKHRPLVICIEVVNPGKDDGSKEWGHLLVDAGYKLVFFDGLNNYYVRKENPEIIARFAYTADLFNFLRKNALPEPSLIQKMKNLLRPLFR